MKLNLKVYIILAGVFILSFGAFFLLPDGNEILGGFIAALGVTALLAALFQLIRDEAQYERRLDEQRREFQFTLGENIGVYHRILQDDTP